MNKEDIYITDWQRILIGEVPGHFFIELIYRSLIIYLILMVSMRMMGKRMTSQLNINELAAMVSLAAAIGIPLQSPDRGLLPAVIIAFIVIPIELLVSKLACRFPAFEKIAQGNRALLVSEGELQTKAMKQTGVSKERIYAQLRSEAIYNLGMVKRLYLEAGGSFSLIKESEEKQGVSIIPEWDTDFYQSQSKEE